MKTILILTLPLAFVVAACDDDHGDLAEERAALAVEEAADAPSTASVRGPQGILQKLDADGDGAISKAEAEGQWLARKFAELDVDADGKVTATELEAMSGKLKRFGKKGRHKDPEARAQWMLEKHDTDQDGTLSRAEVEGSRLAEHFAALDVDQDGRLAPAELSAMKGHGGKGKHRDPEARAQWMFEKLDADRDGVLTPAEVSGHRIADDFAAIDASGDGKITLEEAAAWKKSHKKHDGHRRGHRGGNKGPKSAAG